MSDEPTPLRLKPRLKTPDSPAGDSAAPVPPPETPAEGGEVPKIRLRPKLSIPVEPAPEAAPAAEEPPAEEQPAAEAPIDEAPAYETPPEEVPLEEVPPPPDPTAGGAFPKFKLKFKPAASAPAPAEAAAPEAPPEEIPAEASLGDEANPELGSTAEGEAESPPEDGALPKPRVIQLRLSEDQLPSLDPGEVKVPKVPVPKKAIIMGSVAVVTVAALIFGGKMYLNSRVPPPPLSPPRPKPVVVVVPKPVEPLPDENADATLKLPVPAPKATKPAPKAVIAPAAAAATTNLGGGMSATTTDDVIATDASPAFRSWVATAKIGGVFQGSSPRVLINGRTVRAGAVVDDGLGIIFESVDVDNKMILFKDGTGAVVSRHY